MSEIVSEDHAGVPVPPPLLHALAILAALGLTALYPLRLPVAWWSAFIGLAAMAGAWSIAAWAFREFDAKRNPVPPNQPVGVLMSKGPFRYSRNPLYLALALLHAGLGLLTGNGWILLSLIPALAVVRFHVVAREEAYLIRRFGRAYLDYQARVRRWF